MNRKLVTKLVLPNGVTINNRFFKSAMSETMGDRQHDPSQDLMGLYRQWAQQSIGVIVTGNVMVDRRYLGEPDNVVLDVESNLERFKEWARIGKESGVPIWVQLNHPGKQMLRSISGQPIAPSAIPISGDAKSAFKTPREMTIAEIHEARDKFIGAGLLAKNAGFTGVQIHAAHGYLINQFLSTADNHRSDAYGGTLENRMHFLVEVYQGLREQLGKDFVIALKLNASDFKEQGFGFEECQEVVKTMSELGIDLIEISGGNYEAPVFGSNDESGAIFVNYAVALAQITDVPIVSTGGFRQAADMETAIDGGISMIGLARPFVLYPDLVKVYEQTGELQLSLPRLTTKISKLDQALGTLIGLSYYEAQMKRMGRGKQAKYDNNAWVYLLDAIKTHGLVALRPRRR